eukprot:3938904-Rhodomonas_salina.3
MCHASEQSVKRATEMEKMRIEYEDMKKKVIGGGEFASEDARVAGVKRGSEEMSKGADIWDEFETMMKQENGVKG